MSEVFSYVIAKYVSLIVLQNVTVLRLVLEELKWIHYHSSRNHLDAHLEGVDCIITISQV
jgi:hypothetical protein